MSAATATVQFRIARLIGRSLLSECFFLDVEGWERIPPGNYLLAANHLGRLDPFVILATFPPAPRIHFLAAWETSQESPWKRFCITFLSGLIPVKRGRGRLDAAAIAGVKGVLARGGIVAVFPEGAYGDHEGLLREPLHDGLAHFACATGVPILPVGLNGTSHLHWDRRFTVRIGSPIFVAQTAHPSASEVQGLLDRVAAALRDLIRPAPSVPPRARGEFLNRLLGGPAGFGASLEPPGEGPTGEAPAGGPGTGTAPRREVRP